MTKPLPFKVSTQGSEPSFQASKWLQLHLLLGEQEMASLLREIDPAWIVPMGRVLSAEELTLSQEQFLAAYEQYVQALKRGEAPSPQERAALTVALASDAEAFYLLPVKEERYLLKIRRPVILISEHTLDYSSADGKFRSQIRGPSTITWGVELKYPQLFMDPATGEIVKTMQEGDGLFKKAQSWMRKESLPTQFLVSGEKRVSPVRIGKKALEWVDNHPDLKRKGIEVLHD